MPVTRRSAIRQFLFASAGIVFIPSCIREHKSKSSAILKNLKISDDQEELLAELCETIIPKTDTPGAKDLYAHLFALKMMDDCRSREDQEKFVKGLEAFDSASEKKLGKSFLKSSPAERQALLNELSTANDKDDAAAGFFKTMKRYTIQAYTTSEFFLTKVQIYELVPGRYHGCVPV